MSTPEFKINQRVYFTTMDDKTKRQVNIYGVLVATNARGEAFIEEHLYHAYKEEGRVVGTKKEIVHHRVPLSIVYAVVDPPEVKR